VTSVSVSDFGTHSRSPIIMKKSTRRLPRCRFSPWKQDDEILAVCRRNMPIQCRWLDGMTVNFGRRTRDQSRGNHFGHVVCT